MASDSADINPALFQRLIEQLPKTFPDQQYRVDNGATPYVEFAAKCDEFGPLRIYGEGDELTISSRFTHSHVGMFDEAPDQIVQDVVDELVATFEDQIEHWNVGRASRAGSLGHHLGEVFVWSGRRFNTELKPEPKLK